MGEVYRATDTRLGRGRNHPRADRGRAKCFSGTQSESAGGQPALAEYDLFAPGGTSTGLTVLAPYKELDQGFSVSFVLGFAPPKKV
jgi:hypothetical protein